MRHDDDPIYKTWPPEAKIAAAIVATAIIGVLIWHWRADIGREWQQLWAPLKAPVAITASAEPIWQGSEAATLGPSPQNHTRFLNTVVAPQTQTKPYSPVPMKPHRLAHAKHKKADIAQGLNNDGIVVVLPDAEISDVTFSNVYIRLPKSYVIKNALLTSDFIIVEGVEKPEELLDSLRSHCHHCTITRCFVVMAAEWKKQHLGGNP